MHLIVGTVSFPKISKYKAEYQIDQYTTNCNAYYRKYWKLLLVIVFDFNILSRTLSSQIGKSRIIKASIQSLNRCLLLFNRVNLIIVLSWILQVLLPSLFKLKVIRSRLIVVVCYHTVWQRIIVDWVIDKVIGLICILPLASPFRLTFSITASIPRPTVHVALALIAPNIPTVIATDPSPWVPRTFTACETTVAVAKIRTRLAIVYQLSA